MLDQVVSAILNLPPATKQKEIKRWSVICVTKCCNCWLKCLFKPFIISALAIHFFWPTSSIIILLEFCFKLDFKWNLGKVLQEWHFTKRLEISVIRRNVFRKVPSIWLAALDEHSFTSVPTEKSQGSWEFLPSRISCYLLQHGDH